MYIESMTTPNQIRFPGEPLEPLADAAGLHDAAAHIAAAPDKTAAVLSVTDDAQSAIRRALHYPEEDEGEVYLSPPGTARLDSLRLHQQTNCIGYATVASEALSLAGISHYVAYGQRHWATLIPLESGKGARIQYRDMMLPEFNHDVTDHLAYGSPRSIARSLHEHPDRQHNAILNTNVFAEKLGFTPAELAEAYPYLWGRKGDVLAPEHGWGDVYGPRGKRLAGRMRWIMSIYTAETGRAVMDAYDKFTTAAASGTIDAALGHLESLEGRYPENDSRSKHETVRNLVGRMCLDGGYHDKIPDVIESYFGSIRTGDARVPALRAELYRYVARVTGDKLNASRAIAAYEQASRLTSDRLPSIKRTYLEKRAKVARLALQA